jgi:hypothetical protein
VRSSSGQASFGVVPRAFVCSAILYLPTCSCSFINYFFSGSSMQRLTRSSSCAHTRLLSA